MTLRYQRTPHLVDLVAQAERIAALLDDQPDPDAISAAAVASMRLDGSRIDTAPSDHDVEVARQLRAESLASEVRAAADEDAETWVDALGVVHRVDVQLMALEYLGLLDGLTADQLGPGLMADPVPTLAELHTVLTAGLVEPDRGGEPRSVELTVQDASVGRILYFPVDAAQVVPRLGELGAWMVSDGHREHAIVTSGMVHHDLLAIHPYESANGRVARTAARLLLRARGLDPGGRAAAEVVLAQDPLGYHDEVRRTQRRRDLTVWLERWGEAVVESLRQAARTAGVIKLDLADRAEAFVREWPTTDFTIADYRAGAGVGGSQAQADLNGLLDAGRIVRDPGGRGLRYRVS